MKLRLFFTLLATLPLFASCIKDLESVGKYDTTLCYGVVLDNTSQQPLPDIRITCTNGEKSSQVIYTQSDGTFEIPITVDELGQGYYLFFETDSLYDSHIQTLLGMPWGAGRFDVGTIYLVGPNLPVVITDSTSDLTAASVRCFGTVEDDGKSVVVERGFVYSPVQYPTVENSKKMVGCGLGSFSATLDLTPNTTYYIRAYARNGVGVAYGTQLVATTFPGIAEVITYAVSSITPTSASCGGFVADDGGYPVAQRGVCWSKTMQPTISNAHTADGVGLGAFVSSITGLDPGTTYYVRAYASNVNGVAYGEQVSFTTSDGLPNVATADVSNITRTAAVCGGEVLSDGGFTILSRGVAFSTTPGPTISGPHTSDGVGLGAFVSQLSMLTPGTTYYVRAYATNAVGTIYGTQKIFVTE